MTFGSRYPARAPPGPRSSACCKPPPHPQIAVYDSYGVLHQDREDISGEKRWLAEHTQPGSHGTELGKALDGADVFIEVSAAGLLQEQDVARMADGAPAVFDEHLVPAVARADMDA